MFKKYLFITALLISSSINAVTLFVESLDDTLGGTVLTLRQALIDADSGDTIQFSVTGTILLDEFLGNLIVDKQLTIDGESKIIIDGGNQLTIGFHIANTGTADASNTLIQNITIQNFSGSAVDPGSGTASQELPAYGIFIDSGVLNCSINNCIIENILSGSGDDAAGIYSRADASTISNNTITNIASATATNSGDVFGIHVEGDVQGSCLNNRLSLLMSGDSTNNSGDVTGILVEDSDIQGDCSYNTLQDFKSGIASTVGSGNVRGVIADSVTGNFSHNTMARFISSGGINVQLSGSINGCQVGLIGANCSYNQCTDFTTSDGDGSGDIIVFSIDSIIGDFAYNTIISMTTGFAESPTVFRASGDVRGLLTNSVGGITAYNVLRSFSTGSGRWVSGDIIGLQAATFGSQVIYNELISFSTGSAEFTGLIRGIFSAETNDIVANNTLFYFTTGIATSNNPVGTSFISGSISGISVSTARGRVHDNVLRQFTTGITIPTVVGNSISGEIIGIDINLFLQDDMINNTVHQMVVGASAIEIGASQGIFIQSIESNNLIACNLVQNITGGQDELTFGIQVEEGSNLIIRDNTIDFVTGINGPAHGLILGNNGDAGRVVLNSLVSSNTISNITGSSSDGFGITILGSQDQSVGNDLLNNSIFNINGKAINIVDNEVPVDATVSLQSAVCSANKIFIRGMLDPEIGFEDSEFLVQFFASSSSTPPQIMTFVGETTIQADDTTSFMVEIKTCLTDTTGFITATATAQPSGTNANNNTSEVSNAVTGCDSSTVCSLLCTPVPVTPACPIR